MAIFCSTAIALILKHGEEQNHNRFVILSMNYTMAASISLWLVVKKGLFSSLTDYSQVREAREWLHNKHP